MSYYLPELLGPWSSSLCPSTMLSMQKYKTDACEMTKNTSGLRAAIGIQKALTLLGVNMSDSWEKGETLYYPGPGKCSRNSEKEDHGLA